MVGLSVTAAAIVGVLHLDDSLGLLDYRADVHASLGYLDRTYYSNADRLIGDRRVIEDARLWMPEDAEYRVEGPVGARSQLFYWRTPYLAGAVRYFLLPRRQTDSAAARWVLCLDCDASALGPGFQVLSRGGDGVLFGRTAQ